MSPGYQTAQIAHVIAEYILAHPEEAKQWHDKSNYIIVLETKNCLTLSQLLEKGSQKGLTVQPFHEPDLDYQLTALAFSASEETRKLLGNLPCAGKKWGTKS